MLCYTTEGCFQMEAKMHICHSGSSKWSWNCCQFHGCSSFLPFSPPLFLTSCACAVLQTWQWLLFTPVLQKLPFFSFPFLSSAALVYRALTLHSSKGALCFLSAGEVKLAGSRRTSFSVVAPLLRNSLPRDAHLVSSLTAFKCLVKKQLYKQALNKSLSYPVKVVLTWIAFYCFIHCGFYLF